MAAIPASCALKEDVLLLCHIEEEGAAVFLQLHPAFNARLPNHWVGDQYRSTDHVARGQRMNKKLLYFILCIEQNKLKKTLLESIGKKEKIPEL